MKKMTYTLNSYQKAIFNSIITEYSQKKDVIILINQIGIESTNIKKKNNLVKELFSGLIISIIQLKRYVISLNLEYLRNSLNNLGLSEILNEQIEKSHNKLVRFDINLNDFFVHPPKEKCFTWIYKLDNIINEKNHNKYIYRIRLIWFINDLKNYFFKNPKFSSVHDYFKQFQFINQLINQNQENIAQSLNKAAHENYIKTEKNLLKKNNSNDLGNIIGIIVNNFSNNDILYNEFDFYENQLENITPFIQFKYKDSINKTRSARSILFLLKLIFEGKEKVFNQLSDFEDNTRIRLSFDKKANRIIQKHLII